MFFKFYCNGDTICTYIDLGKVELDEAREEIQIFEKDGSHRIGIQSVRKGYALTAFSDICKGISDGNNFFDLTEYQGE